MKVPNNDENYQNCICNGCPTHNECMKEKKEKLFCSRGKSQCKIEKQGCICGECPVASKYNLNKLYYCVNGAEG